MSWASFAAPKPERAIPGDGNPTDMEQVTTCTRNCLVYMPVQVGEVIDPVGDLQAAYAIDQTA